MKRCLLCGCIDEAGTAKTCPKDGEATWAEVPSLAALVAEAEPVEETAPAKPKRGRPKGS